MIDRQDKKSQDRKTLSPQILTILPNQQKQKLTIKTLQEIRKAFKKQPLYSLMESVRKISFLTNQLKAKNPFKDKAQVNQKLKTIISSSQYVDLLKTGEYKISQANKTRQKHLIFTDCMIQYFRKQNAQNLYTGFKYEFNKSLYIGQFIVTNKSILYQTEQKGRQGQLYYIESQTRYIKYTGKWKDGSIIYGKKQIYKFNSWEYQGLYSSNSDGYAEQCYEGEFLNMKYHGDGTLKKYKLEQNQIKTKEQPQIKKGKFKHGAFVAEVK